MKLQARIFDLGAKKFTVRIYFWFDDAIHHTANYILLKPFSHPQSARRAAKRIAKKLGLELEWV